MLLGFWLAGSLIMTFIAADSANAAGRMIISHGTAAGLRISAMGREEARIMLAYPVRQQVRWWLDEWGNLELALGAFFFLFLLFGTREGKLTLSFTLGIYAIVLFQRLFTLPQMLYLGAQMDFVPTNVVLPERNQLIAVQNAFAGVEIFKALAIFGLAFIYSDRPHAALKPRLGSHRYGRRIRSPPCRWVIEAVPPPSWR